MIYIGYAFLVYFALGTAISLHPENFKVTKDDKTIEKVLFVIVGAIFWLPFMVYNVYKLWDQMKRG